MPNTTPNYETAFRGIQAAAFNSDFSDIALGQFTRMTCFGVQALSAPPITAPTAPAAATNGSNTSTNRGRGAGNGARRVRADSKRETILKLLREQNGLTRGEILEKLGLKGNEAGESSTSNAISALRKNGAIVSQNNRWYLHEAATTAQTAATTQDQETETEQLRTGTMG